MLAILTRLFRRERESENLETGKWGESEAERLLCSKGYRILGRRVRFGPREEIDLVARDEDVLVFVEVKARKEESFGRPLEAVKPRKRRLLSRAAVRYLKRAGWRPTFFRFDVVEVVGEPQAAPEAVRHIENVFTLDRHYQLPF